MPCCRCAVETLLKYPKHSRFVLVTPEKATSDNFLRFLPLLHRPLRFVVDEAHCIVEWGDFRPSYRQLSVIKETFPTAPVLAMTGTGTASDATDIASALGCPAASFIIGDTARPEILYSASGDRSGRALKDSFPRLMEILETHATDCGLVFVSTVKGVQDTLAAITEHFGDSLPATCYHGQLPYQEKQARAQGWASGAARVMVATSSFGMGINNPSCRFVVHLQLPSSLVAYQQESGRAGRDGRPAKAYLLASRSDHSVWAPIFSRSAREYVIRQHNGEPPPAAAFLSATLAITVPQHRRVEEVFLFAALPLCRRWLLAAGVSAACASPVRLSLCTPHNACDVCQEKRDGRRTARADLTKHATFILAILDEMADKGIVSTVDDVTLVFMRSKRVEGLHELRSMASYQPTFAARLDAAAPAPTARLAGKVISVLIARGEIEQRALPPDMNASDVDEDEEGHVTFVASNGAIIRRRHTLCLALPRHDRSLNTPLVSAHPVFMDL